MCVLFFILVILRRVVPPFPLQGFLSLGPFGCQKLKQKDCTTLLF